MTTITIERAFLIKVLDHLDIAQSLLERSQHHAKIAAMYKELRAALAAPATAPEPSWQDEPTCAGLWFCDEGDENPYRFTCHNVSMPLNPHLVGEDERWYGPIPPDGDKP